MVSDTIRYAHVRTVCAKSGEIPALTRNGGP